MLLQPTLLGSLLVDWVRERERVRSNKCRLKEKFHSLSPQPVMLLLSVSRNESILFNITFSVTFFCSLLRFLSKIVSFDNQSSFEVFAMSLFVTHLDCWDCWEEITFLPFFIFSALPSEPSRMSEFLTHSLTHSGSTRKRVTILKWSLECVQEQAVS